MRKVRGYKIDTFFALASFSVFAASMLVVLLFGATIYKDAVKKSHEGSEERTCLSYIWTKIKTNDTAGKIYAGEFRGLSALYLEEDDEYTTYITTIYLYDGWVRELFHETGLEFSPEDGTPIIEADTLDFEQKDGLIKATVNSEYLYTFPCGEAAVYHIEGQR